MENLPDFYKRLSSLILKLDIEELKALHESFEENKVYGKDFSFSEVGDDIDKLRKAVNIGIQKIPIEELKSFVPPMISEVIEEYLLKSEQQTKIDLKTPDPKESRESKKSLLLEAINISSQRSSGNEEMPADKKERLGYVLAKLHTQFSMSQRQIADATNISRGTISEYIDMCMKNNPDLVSMWVQAKQKIALESADVIPKDTDRSMENIAGAQTAGLLIEDAKDIGKSIAVQRQEMGKYVMETIGTTAQQFGFQSYMEFLKYEHEFFIKYQGKIEELESQKAELLQINAMLQEIIEEDTVGVNAAQAIERIMVAAIIGGGNIDIESLSAYKKLLLKDPDQMKYSNQNDAKNANNKGEPQIFA